MAIKYLERNLFLFRLVRGNKYYAYYKKLKNIKMRLFINKCTFISVITTDLGFSCQVMDLLNGVGLYPLSIDEDQTNAVSTINHRYPLYICHSLDELFAYHKDILCTFDIYDEIVDDVISI